MNVAATLGIIGGSGLYEMPGLQDAQELSVVTPFGQTSAPIIAGTLEGTRVAFLARHGQGHHLTPTEVPFRANIYALKSLGVERIVSISACGSLKEELAPGSIVIPDQIYDNTHGRARSFFGEGFVAHLEGMFGFALWDSRQKKLLVARSYFDQGRVGEALGQAQDAAASDRASAGALEGVAAYATAAGRFDLAIDALERAARLPGAKPGAKPPAKPAAKPRPAAKPKARAAAKKKPRRKAP